MDFSFSDEQKALRDSIVKFARAELNRNVVERDRAETFSREAWRKCAEIGIQGMPVPEEYGGSGADPLSCAIALEALGYGCRDGGLVFSLCAHLLACVVPIWKHGSEDAEGSLPERIVRRNADRRPCDHRTRFGFGHVRHALARPARWRAGGA